MIALNERVLRPLEEPIYEAAAVHLEELSKGHNHWFWDCGICGGAKLIRRALKERKQIP